MEVKPIWETILALFFMNKKYVSLLIIVSMVMAVVYLGQSMLWSDAYEVYLYNSHALTESRFEYRFDSISKSEFDELIDNLPSGIDSLLDMQIRKEVFLTREENYYNSSIILTAYHMPFYSDRFVQILYGKNPDGLVDGEVFVLDKNSFVSTYSDGKYRIFIDGKPFIIRGEGVIVDEDMLVAGGFNNMTSVWVTENDFFSMSDSVERIVLQYRKPLSISQEKQLNDYMNSKLNLRNYIGPYKTNEADAQYIGQKMLVAIICSVICLICNYGLIDYYLGKRKSTYMIYRIYGATKLYVIKKQFLEVLLIILTSTILGSLLFCILNYSLKNRGFSNYDSLFWISNIGIYFVIITVFFAVFQIWNYVKNRQCIINFEDY